MRITFHKRLLCGGDEPSAQNCDFCHCELRCPLWLVEKVVVSHELRKWGRGCLGPLLLKFDIILLTFWYRNIFFLVSSR